MHNTSPVQRSDKPLMSSAWNWLLKKRAVPDNGADASLLFRKSLDRQRLVFLNATALLFTIVATFRSFGFDLDGADALRNVFPFVADGWGLWYWLAELGLGFTLFFLLVNLLLAEQIFRLAWPKRPGRFFVVVSVTIVVYCAFWFLFGQARWGTAVTSLAAASMTGSIPLIVFVGALATVIHKAAAGGLVLVIAWILLSRMKYGLIIAMVISGAVSYAVLIEGPNLLVLAGYSQYLNWDKLPSAETPFKYYYFLAVISLGLFFKNNDSIRLLILTLLFLPFSYFIVFAGRSYQMYAVILLACLLTGSMPKIITCLLLVPYAVDIFNLIFYSGFFFPV